MREEQATPNDKMRSATGDGSKGTTHGQRPRRHEGTTRSLPLLWVHEMLDTFRRFDLWKHGRTGLD